jgi:hypothetical protein
MASPPHWSTLSALYAFANLFGRRRKCAEARGPGLPEKLKGSAAQQAPLKVRVAANVIPPDRSVLSSAVVPCGPNCAIEVVTEVMASPPHWSTGAPVIPTAVATNAWRNM